MAEADPRDFQIKIKLSVCSVGKDEDDHSGVLSKGTVALLRGIKDKGSLNKAAKDLHMAYSKAWRIMKETEAALGTQLLNRDGAHGSTLTKDGNRILDAYLETEEYLQKLAEEEFTKRLGK